MKPKTCKFKFDPCFDLRVNYPGKSILSPYCAHHLIVATVTKVRENVIKCRSNEKKEKTIELMSVDTYRKKYVQPIFNEIARLIDYGQPCIATGNYGKLSGGHYYSTGSNRTLTLNLHNIHVQSFQSNGPKGGDNIKYREGIIKTYGIAYMEKIEALKSLNPLKLTKGDLIEIKQIASEIRNTLRKTAIIRTPAERIDLRELINQRIGIYL